MCLLPLIVLLSTCANSNRKDAIFVSVDSSSDHSCGGLRLKPDFFSPSHFFEDEKHTYLSTWFVKPIVRHGSLVTKAHSFPGYVSLGFIQVACQLRLLLSRYQLTRVAG